MKVLMFLTFTAGSSALALQRFTETPVYAEVNPLGTVVMNCVVEDMKGECRWEKDGVPVGLYDGKYEMVNSGSGDCSIRILDASMEYDNGVWQCQVTASDFTQKDTLISDGAQLVVRVAPDAPLIRKAGGGRLEVGLTARAGEDLDLECVSEGGNPAPLLSWRLRGQALPLSEDQVDKRLPGGLWRSVLRLKIPVSREDNGAELECVVEHSAVEEPVSTSIQLEIFYPPRVEVNTSTPDPTTEGTTVTLTCTAESNPPARITWRKLDATAGADIVGRSSTLTLEPVVRTDAGTYQCSAENELGLSKPKSVPVHVRYAPVIVGLSASGVLKVHTGEEKVLRCHAEGSPPPSIQWLQQTQSGEVLVRGYEPELRIERASYAHQGSFVCAARNQIGEVQSDPVQVEVHGRPEIDRFKAKTEHVLNLGDDLTAVVEFCAKPRPRATWNLGAVGQAGRTVELIAGSTFERFHAGDLVETSDHCYSATLRVARLQLSDSREFQLRLENEYGRESISTRVVVIDTRLFTEEVFAAIIVGGVLTILLLTVVIIYVVRVGCCAGEVKQDIAGSDKTDLESCRSSTVSNHSHHTVIPPDALYGTVKKTGFFEPEFNNSKEKLRPDLIQSGANSPYSGRNYTVNPGLINPVESGQGGQGVYNPARNQPQAGTDNYSGSYRGRKKVPEYRNQGVDCQIENPSRSASSTDEMLYAYSAQYRPDL